MANVGSAAAGKTLIAAGQGASPTFASIGTNSGLTANGVLIAEGNGAFQATSAGTLGQVLVSNGPGVNPSFQASSSSGAVTTLTGDSGGAVNPTAGNINVLGSGSITTSGAGSTLTTQLTGLTNHAVLVGAGTTTITKVGPTATSGQVLQSAGAAADPAFSTAIYPATTTINQILYSSAANTVTGITAANSASLVSSSTGIPSWAAMTSGQLIIGNTGGTPTAALPTSTGGNFIAGAGSLLYIPANYQPGFSNLGMTYSAGTFTVNGFNGSALSSTNPAYVTLQSTTAGQLVTIAVTANQTFTDAAGTNQISGNNFGVTAGVAWNVDTPFFLYAVLKSDQTAIAFMISRSPSRLAAPAAGNIGQSGSALATTQGSFFSLASITAANYASQPCICLGAFRMRKTTTSNDWTVQALSSVTDGFGRFPVNTYFTFPQGQNGAAANTYLTANGGTAPVFTTNEYTYNITSDLTFVTIQFFMSGDGGTDGAGGVQAQLAVPFVEATGVNETIYSPFPANSVGTGATLATCQFVAGSPANLFIATTQVSFTNGNFSNGGRYLIGNFRYPISNG